MLNEEKKPSSLLEAHQQWLDEKDRRTQYEAALQNVSMQRAVQNNNTAQGYLNAVLQNAQGVVTGTYRNGVLVSNTPPRVSDIQLHSGDLASPLFDTPLPTLSVMWQVRFGLGWVTERQIMAAVQEPGSEWGLLFSRLNARNVFERHTLYDTGENVFRLIQES